MSLIKLSKFFLSASTVLVVTGIVLIIFPGPKFSIDFTGGTLMEIVIPEENTKEDLQNALNAFQYKEPLGNVSISRTKRGSMLLRMRDIPNEEHLALISHLENTFISVEEHQYTTIGPTVGASLKSRAIWSLIIAGIAIILYIAFAFRKIPKKLSAFRFGVVAVIAVLHDIIITIGIFIILSQYTSFEIDTLFVTALLTIIGYSVNDTIIIFDRIRDNLGTQSRNEPFADVAERSVIQSITRSINTSFSTLIMLFALFFLGTESIRWFILTLIVGITIGTYSSIFIATPLLVFWKKRG